MKIMFDNEVGLSKTVIMSARNKINEPGTGRVTYHEGLADTTLKMEPCPASNYKEERT